MDYFEKYHMPMLWDESGKAIPATRYPNRAHNLDVFYRVALDNFRYGHITNVELEKIKRERDSYMYEENKRLLKEQIYAVDSLAQKLREKAVVVSAAYSDYAEKRTLSLQLRTTALDLETFAVQLAADLGALKKENDFVSKLSRGLAHYILNQAPGTTLEVAIEEYLRKDYQGVMTNPTLIEFARYMQANPGQRFWQALKNWANVESIHASVPVALRAGLLRRVIDYSYKLENTYNWKGRNG